jgi:hypothetical protein
MSETNTWDEFPEWLQIGIDKGWISPGFCYTHDGDPYITDEEEAEWAAGGDPCFPIFRYLG